MPDPGDDAWSEAFGVGASRPGEGDDGTGVPGADPAAGADAVTSAFDFEPDGVSSDEDYDVTGDGIVDHHDAHEALTGFHDFHVGEADAVHAGHGDHGDHGDVHGDFAASHDAPHDAGHHLHDGAHDGGTEFFAL